MQAQGMTDNTQIVRDIEDLIHRISLITKDFDTTARKKIMTKAAAPMVMAAKIKAPVGTRPRHKMGKVEFMAGNLANSIEILKHGPFTTSAYTYIGPRYPGRVKSNVAPYAHMVEFGTVKQSAQPFLATAFRQHVENVFARAKKGYTELLDSRLVKLGVK
jgi:HK97 gp10 family phage protein